MAAHLEGCAQCQREIADFDRFFGLAGQVSDSIATGRRRAGLAAARRTRFRQIAASVALLIASSAALAFFLTRGAEVARADDVLRKAVDAEQLLDESPAAIYLASHEVVCPMGGESISVAAPTPSPTAAEGPAPCGGLMERLRQSGWTEGPLSAAAFRQWRHNLTESTDVVREQDRVITLLTETPETLLRGVEMRMRIPSYQVLAVTFRFAIGEGLDTEVMEVAALEPAALPAAAAALSDATVAVPPAQLEDGTPTSLAEGPGASLLDAAELRVRQLLRQWKLDQDVLLHVERGPDEVLVQGVIESAATLRAVTGELAGWSPLRIEVGLPGEGVHVPWQTFQGDREPVAFQRLNDLFPSNTDGRESLVNAMTSASRRIAGASRMHGGAVALRARLRDPQAQAEAEILVRELAAEIFRDKQEIARGLATLTGPVSVSDRAVSADEGRRLYDLVHALVFMGRPGIAESPDALMQQVAALLD